MTAPRNPYLNVVREWVDRNVPGNKALLAIHPATKRPIGDGWPNRSVSDTVTSTPLTG